MTPSSCMTEPTTKPRLLELALTFNRISLSSVGSGLSAWARRVIVEEKKWLDDEEFLSALTLSRVLPGANQMNFAVYVGNRSVPSDGSALRRACLCGIRFLEGPANRCARDPWPSVFPLGLAAPRKSDVS